VVVVVVSDIVVSVIVLKNVVVMVFSNVDNVVVVNIPRISLS